MEVPDQRRLSRKCVLARDWSRHDRYPAGWKRPLPEDLGLARDFPGLLAWDVRVVEGSSQGAGNRRPGGTGADLGDWPHQEGHRSRAGIATEVRRLSCRSFRQSLGSGSSSHATQTPDAEVFVGGTFNLWKPSGSDRLRDKNHDGSYRTLLQLRSGRHEYKFLVNGKWLINPDLPVSASDNKDAHPQQCDGGCLIPAAANRCRRTEHAARVRFVVIRRPLPFKLSP